MGIVKVLTGITTLTNTAYRFGTLTVFLSVLLVIYIYILYNNCRSLDIFYFSDPFSVNPRDGCAYQKTVFNRSRG